MALFWRTNITWNSGERLASGAGPRAGMRTSSGISWCSNASRATSRTRREDSRRSDPREVGAEREHVDEVADQSFGFRPRPVGHRRSDGEIVLAAPSTQQQLEGGEQRHVRRDALAPAERGTASESSGEITRRRIRRGGSGSADVADPPAAPGTARRRDDVSSARSHRSTRRSELLALPEDEVGILDRRLGQRGGEALAIGLVERRQLAGGDAQDQPSVIRWCIVTSAA